MTTSVFSKDSLTDTEVQLDISSDLKFGETLTSVGVQSVSPITSDMLVVTRLSAIDNHVVNLLLTHGKIGISYGFQLLITTSARQLVHQVAVAVVSDAQVPYPTQDPMAYTDLVDTIESGQSCIGTAVFTFPSTVDPAGGYVTWDLFDAQAITYASGNAFDYTIQSNGLANTVFAKAVISVPSDVPSSDLNSKYQLRYTLTMQSGEQVYSNENVTVIGLTTVPIGTQDLLEIRGKKAQMSIVIPRLYDTVTVQLYSDNTLLGETTVQDFTKVSSGYYYAATFDTLGLVENLEPYTVVWSYSNTVNPNEVFSETANLWICNQTMLMAMSDMKAKVTKARTTLYGTPDLLFPPSTLMLWLRRARDAFNGGPGGFTGFTMLNAKGGIREYWLLYAEMMAIEQQYLAEGEKAFNFSGAAISLDIDRTGYLDNAASKIQTRLDSEFKAFKQNLIIKGVTQGDGSTDPTRLQKGAIGAVGITITPASPWGPYRSGLPYPNVGGRL